MAGYIKTVDKLWGVVPGMPDKKDPGFKHPSNCDLCGKKILEADYYYLGIDEQGVLAATCADTRCTRWLKHKRKLQKLGMYLGED